MSWRYLEKEYGAGKNQDGSDRTRMHPCRTSLSVFVSCIIPSPWKGRNGFLYKQLASLNALAVIDYDFDWSSNIGANGIIQNQQGQVMKITTTAPPIPAKRLVRSFEETTEGKRLKRNATYSFQGVNADGRYVFKPFHDTYIGTQQPD